MAFAALVIDLNARLANLQQGLDRAVQISERSAKQIESAFSFGGAAKAGAGFFAAQLGLESLRDALVKVKDLSDEWTRTRVLIENVTNSIGEAERAQRGLYEAAQATRQNFGELSRSYASFARNSEQLGITSDEAVKLQTTVAQAIALSGARADSAASALVQFGQGIASGTLRGEELNSVLEQTPKLAKALADGLGVPIGQLIKMGKEGELSADKIIEALRKVAPQLQSEFDKVTPTIADSFTALNNALGNVVNRFNEVTGVASRLSSIILGVASGIDKIVEFSRFDPAVAVRNVTSLQANQLALNRNAIDALTNRENPRYNADIPSAMRAAQVERLSAAVARLEQEISGTQSRAAEFGFTTDGKVLPDNAIRNFQQQERLKRQNSELAEQLGALNAELNGISKAFEKNAEILRKGRDAGILTPQAYEEQMKLLMKKSGFFPDAKKADTSDPLKDIIRDAERRDAELERIRERVLSTLDPARKLRQELDDIDKLEKRGAAAGGISAEQAAQARATVLNEIADIEERLAKERRNQAEPLTEVREALDEYIKGLRVEADLLQYSEQDRAARVKLLDFEKQGLEEGSAEWERYRASIVDALSAVRLSQIDQQKGGAFDRRTSDLQLAVSDFNRQLALDNSPDNLERLQNQFRERASAILYLTKVAQDEVFKLGEAFSSAFEKAVVQGGKLSDVLRGLAQDIASLYLRQQITGPLAKAINDASGGSSGDTLFSLFRGILGFANGGQPPVGVPSIVGERGPELFVPKTVGTIVPAGKFGGGVTINQVVNVGSGVNRSDVAAAMLAAKESAKAEILQSMRRGGAYAVA